MIQIPQSEYRSIEETCWTILISLPLNAGVRNTYGVFNKQLKELNNCGITRLSVTDAAGYNCFIKVFLNKDFVNQLGKEKTSSFLNEFIQEYLNLNNLKLSSFKTDFVKEVTSLKNFEYTKSEETENKEEHSLIDIFEKRKKLI